MHLGVPQSYLKPNVEKSGAVVSRETFFTILENGGFSREDIGVMVRDRYGQTALQVDRQFEIAYENYVLDNNPITLNLLRQALGKLGAFNYIRGISILKKDHSIDRTVAPRVMITPSASIQLLDIAKLTSSDRVLEVFCGVGYFSFFLALEQPAVLDCIDLHSPQTYDLDETFQKGFEWIYSEISQALRPNFTTPKFILHDAQALASCEHLHLPYTKAFLHPPFGRESTRIDAIGELDEIKAFGLWIKSLSSLHRLHPVPFCAFSLVPTEWPESILEWQNSSNDLDLTTILVEKLRQLPYYKEKQLIFSSHNMREPNVDMTVLKGLKYSEVKEMRLFRQTIVMTNN